MDTTTKNLIALLEGGDLELRMATMRVIAELGVGAALPIALFASARVRESRSGLFLAATAVVIGDVAGATRHQRRCHRRARRQG